MKNIKLLLGKKGGTLGVGNRFWIKKFEEGVKIRTRGEGEITLGVWEVFEMVSYLRKFCKKRGGSFLLSPVDLSCIWQKYPETEKFMKRLIADEVGWEEQEEIGRMYELKNKIIENLK